MQDPYFIGSSPCRQILEILVLIPGLIIRGPLEAPGGGGGGWTLGRSTGRLALRRRLQLALAQQGLPGVPALLVGFLGVVALVASAGDGLEVLEGQLADHERVIAGREQVDQALERLAASRRLPG